jgi:hypothetical protein
MVLCRNPCFSQRAHGQKSRRLAALYLALFVTVETAALFALMLGNFCFSVFFYIGHCEENPFSFCQSYSLVIVKNEFWRASKSIYRAMSAPWLVISSKWGII